MEELPVSLKKLVAVIAVAWTLFQLYTGFFGLLPAILQRSATMGFALVLTFWGYRGSKGKKGKIPLQDWIFAALSVACILYLYVNFDYLVARGGSPTRMDVLMGCVAILLVLEAARRCVGMPLVIVALAFLAYAFAGPYLPSLLGHRGYSLSRVSSQLFITLEGLLGTPMSVATTFVFAFILFGCFLECTGGAVENATLIMDGSLDLGFVAASTLYDAQHGLNSFEDKNTDQCLAVFSFFPEVVQILSADFLGFSDAASGLKDHTVDVAFTWAGIPTASVMELGTTHSISMIHFTDEELEDLMQISSYCVPAKITKECYPSLYEDTQTFSIPAIICCSADMSDEFVYDLLTTLFDNLDLLAQTHERGGDLSLETALDGLEGAKLHPGAEKFFREKGLL